MSPKPELTVQQFMSEAVDRLQRAGISSPRLDCLILLEDILHLNRSNLIAHPEMAISDQQSEQLTRLLKKRLQHMPLAYIRGWVEFYGRIFAVNRHVLIPRPDSEAMIDMVKNLNLPAHPSILDIGTGSGCLGITAALEITHADIYMTDIDRQALKLALRNSRAHKVTVQITQQDLLTSTNQDFDVILANLPYVPDALDANQDLTFEPKLALFAGSDGMAVYREFWNQLSTLSHQSAYILTESLVQQHDCMTSLAQSAGYKLLQSQDLIQCFSLREQYQGSRLE